MKTSDFDFELPESYIATSPAEPRDNCKLLVFNTATGEIFHKRFFEIGEFLDNNDVLVLNRSRVIPARFLFDKKEVFLLKKLEENLYQSLVRPGKFFKIRQKFEIEKGFFGQVKDVLEDGTRAIFFSGADVQERMKALGKIPLPPYIKAELGDPEDYQTIYAKEEGSVAAPTAGLHFTEKLFRNLGSVGVEFEEVILHVGRGTFLPVSAEKLEDHVMHEEVFEMPQSAAFNLNQALKDGKRIIAVGTTSVRVLESNFDNGFHPAASETDIFIYPGKYKWKVVDGLVTNFHLPKSTLIMLVASFLENKGVKRPVEKVLELYEIAKKEEYRFYSFGDAMLLI